MGAKVGKSYIPEKYAKWWCTRNEKGYIRIVTVFYILSQYEFKSI
jgi:hypothetical protein